MVIHPFINPAIHPSIHLLILPCLSFILIPFLPPLSSFLTVTPSHLYHSFIYSLTHSFVSLIIYLISWYSPLSSLLSFPPYLHPSSLPFSSFPFSIFPSSLFLFPFCCPYFLSLLHFSHLWPLLYPLWPYCTHLSSLLPPSFPSSFLTNPMQKWFLD